MITEEPVPADDAAFMRSILESSSDCIKVLGLDGSLLFMNSGGQKVMEVDDFDRLRGCHWPDFWSGEGHVHARDAVLAALAGKISHFEGEAPTAKGSQRFWEVVVSPILDDHGKPIRILSVSRDVTPRKKIELQRETLARELVHRVNNLLAVVGAIVTQSLRSATTMHDAEKAIAGRIRTLANANSVLTGGQNIHTSVSAIVKSAVEPYIDNPARISTSGPEVELSSRACVSFALAINELSTNATKYGALSAPFGRVDVRWQIHDGNFLLEWKESGGPAVQQPSKSNFGSTLIKSMFATQMRGSATMLFEPDGLICRLEAPVEALTQEG